MKEKGFRDVFYYFVFLLLSIFLSLTYLVLNGYTQYVDEIVSDYFFFNSSVFMTALMISFSVLGSYWFLFFFSIVLCFMLFLFRKWAYAGFYALSLIVGGILSEILKGMILRERPINAFLTDYSYPSGHSIGSTIAYGSLGILSWKYDKRISFVFFAFPFIIGFSRVYTRVHWVSDVLAGWVLGGLVLSLFYFLFFEYLDKNKNQGVFF
jgi:undecaprenyl-diphosphatase